MPAIRSSCLRLWGSENRPGQAGEGSRHRSRAEREATLQRWIVRGVIGVSALLAIILLVALVITQLIAPNEVIARVYDQKITAAQFQQRFLLERALISNQLNNLVSYYQLLGLSNEEINQQLLSDSQVSSWQNELTIPDQLGIRVIQTLAEELLIQRASQQMGLTVEEAEIEAERASYFNYSDATATPIVTANGFPSPQRHRDVNRLTYAQQNPYPHAHPCQRDADCFPSPRRDGHHHAPTQQYPWPNQHPYPHPHRRRTARELRNQRVRF